MWTTFSRLPLYYVSLVLSSILLCTTIVDAQGMNGQPAEREQWSAEWISHPTLSLRDPAVLHFKKVIYITEKPAHFVVDVSADNRFILFVNDHRIGEGPARGDLAHWRYESFDLAPALEAGDNVITAVVWNWGIFAPLAQLSDRTAFLMQGDTARESIVDTGPSWQVELDAGFTFIPRVANGLWSYWAADPGERLDARMHDWKWMDQSSSASQWVSASDAMRESIYPSAGHPSSRHNGFTTPWALVPDDLPQMENLQVPAGHVVRTDLPTVGSFPDGDVVIPANSTARILIDRSTMVSGYPDLEVSGGNGAVIKIGYTEALYDAQQQRGNRNDVGDRKVLGLSDEFVTDGAANRHFIPLWFRTWRYLELSVRTDAAALTLERLNVLSSSFPLKERASFVSSNPELAQIWDICWRTARLGAHETYMDTPFWEQLQYIDDTRIQALISYTVGGEDRLARQALLAFDDSRVPEGITQSRYPSKLPQFIPNFSLSYIGMMHDYWMYRPDKEFVRRLLPGTRPVLQWFVDRQRPDLFLQQLPYWVAIDSPEGVKTYPRLDAEGRSALVTLLFVSALQDAAELEATLGDKSVAVRYRRLAKRTSAAIYAHCWNSKTGLLADTPDQDSYSQHTNIFGILTDVIPVSDQRRVMNRLLENDTAQTNIKLANASYHYQFHLSRAIDKIGAGGKYLDTLGPWHTMLAKGLTTTPEFADPSRSDTHAWSAHPIYDLLTIVAGIHPFKAGFSSIVMSPHPGRLREFDASMPHPNGEIRIQYRRVQGKTQFKIALPQHLSGSLRWQGKTYPLHAGVQSLRLQSRQ